MTEIWESSFIENAKDVGISNRRIRRFGRRTSPSNGDFGRYYHTGIGYGRNARGLYGQRHAGNRNRDFANGD